jgi:hypothetical protein
VRIVVALKDPSMSNKATLCQLTLVKLPTPDLVVHPFLHRRMGPSPGSKNLEAHRIANSDRVIGYCCRQTEIAIKIELLMRRNLVCYAEIDHVLRTTALGKGAGMLDVCVPGPRKLPVKI